MNLTLAALQLTNIVSLSPQFAGKYTNFACTGCKFSQSFTTIAKLRHFHNAKFTDTRFTRFLDSAISIDTQEFRKLTYNETCNFSEESVTFQKCLFIECSNINGSGGAIYATSLEEECRIAIQNCGFYACRSSLDGGAISVHRVRTLELEHVCFTNCSTDSGQGNSIYSLTGEDMSLTSVAFLSSPEIGESESSQFYGRSVKTWMQYVNISNSEDSCLAFVSSYFCEMKYLHCSGAHTDHLMHLRHVSTLIRYVDVVNSTFKQSIFFLNESKLSVVRGVFVNVRGPFISMQNSGDSACRVTGVSFRECSVDFDESAITARRIDFDAENATLISPVPMNTDYCWFGRPTWDVDGVEFKLSGASITFIFICVFVFVLYCLMKEKLADPGGLDKKNEAIRRKSSEWVERDTEPRSEKEEENSPMISLTETVAEEAKSEPKQKDRSVYQ